MSKPSARQHILGRIRQAQGRRDPASLEAEAARVAARIAARPRGPLPSVSTAFEATFRRRAESMQSTTESVASWEEVPPAVARYLEAQGLARRGCVWPSLSHLDWLGAGLDLSPRPARDEDAIGVTSVFAAIAETGTVMVISGKETPSSVSLLPATHIAAIPATRIVAYAEDAWDLARRELGELPRAVNFISGPSRTADIDQTMVLGAHGPARVHLIVVAGA
jgi:L-lactate dehydrogenase complex protein LldG